MKKTYEMLLAAMTDSYRQMTGCNADDASDIGIRMKVLARELSQLYDRLTQLERQLFPQTSDGLCLEHHAQTRGLERKGAVAAQGVLRFSRSQAAQADIPIPKGTLCSTVGEPSCRFSTTEAGVLQAGALWTEIPARSVEAGAQSNVAAGVVTLMVTPVSQISTVSNPRPFVGGNGRQK